MPLIFNNCMVVPPVTSSWMFPKSKVLHIHKNKSKLKKYRIKAKYIFSVQKIRYSLKKQFHCNYR